VSRNITLLQAVAIAGLMGAGMITRATAEREMFTDEELAMSPEERRIRAMTPKPPAPPSGPTAADLERQRRAAEKRARKAKKQARGFGHVGSSQLTKEA
jgi:hypothetical protein